MNKKISAFLAFLILGGVLVECLNAQNIFIKEATTRFLEGDGFCDTIDYNNLGSNVSYIKSGGNVWRDSALIEYEKPKTTYPGACLGLCVSLRCLSTGTDFGVDDLTFEVFKFGSGANPMDAASTPPIRTFSMNNVGVCPGNPNDPQPVEKPVGNGYFCTAWDGMYNINGIFGKTNGQYGFRAKAKTNQTSETLGNISVEHTAAYPGQNQVPIQIDVTNIHSVRSSPTVVGKITGVAAQPYNFLYRLTKDATTAITIYEAVEGLPPVRTVVSNLPRVGEGTPDGTLTNGDFWDGRNNAGSMMPAGLYMVYIDAYSHDEISGITDNAWTYHFQMGLDPLQITDVAIRPLGSASTDVAVISYMLTEAATVYVDIYPPGTSFTSVNASPPNGATNTILRHIVEQQDKRTTVSTYWDGRDENGNILCDGDYVYAIYASLPSNAAVASGNKVWTSKTIVGVVPIARGLVVSFISPASTVMGSSPSVAGLDPFYFRYTPLRDTLVTLNIIPTGSVTPVRHLLDREARSADFSNREVWDGKNDDGNYVSSGTYMAELVTEDPFQCPYYKDYRATVVFPVNMFRIMDVRTTPLMGGASDTATISFEMSQAMFVELNVYPVSVTVDPSSSTWPKVSPALPPVYSVSGIRPGRFRITEFWDGRDKDGLLVPDGRYPFTLVAHTTGTAKVMYATDKAYGYVDVARGQIIFTMFEVTPSIPTMYNSSDTVELPPYEIDYVITRQSSVSVKIMDLNLPPRTMANVVSGGIRDGDIIYKDFWDGKDDRGNFVPGGAYNVRIVAQDIASQLSSLATAQQTIEIFPLRIFDVSITPLTLENPAVISYQLSEPMTVVTQIFKPGTSFGADGSPYPPASASLVKRIIGVRPARTSISEYWDGTDLTLSKVPDGNYVFKIYGSTISGNISAIDGSITPGTLLADDVISANVPVTKSGTADLCGDFSHDTFFYPNPYEGTSGKFNIPVLLNGNVSLKLYNLTGDLVYKYDFGSRGERDTITHPWPKVNSSGRTVAGGVYLAVIRFEATDGSMQTCQTVKKILIP